MDKIYNKHYVLTDERGCITTAWSDGPYPQLDVSSAVCINDKGSYQFRLTPEGEENPPIHTKDAIPLYKLVDGQVVPRSEEEIAADRAVIPAPGPTAAERLEAQVTYTAMMTDTLLEVD